MTNRDQEILSLRPDLNLPSASSPMEQFQNLTLRPVLKFQNELLLDICRQQFVKRKSVFDKLSEAKQLEYIEQQISRDTSFKSLLHGVILGQLTSEELSFYLSHEAEVRKRITNLLTQRLQSQSASLVNEAD